VYILWLQSFIYFLIDIIDQSLWLPLSTSDFMLNDLEAVNGQLGLFWMEEETIR